MYYHYNTQRVYFVLKLCFIRILLVFISNICVLLYVICQFCNSTHQKPTVWCSSIKLQIPLKPNINTQQAPTQPVQKTTIWIEGSVRFFSFSVSSRKTRSEMYRDAKLTKCNLLSIASLRVDFTWLMTAFKKQSKCMKVYMMPKTFKYVSQHAVTLCVQRLLRLTPWRVRYFRRFYVWAMCFDFFIRFVSLQQMQRELIVTGPGRASAAASSEASAASSSAAEGAEVTPRQEKRETRGGWRHGLCNKHIWVIISHQRLWVT